MQCIHCGQDLKEGVYHIPMGEMDMGDYKAKTCYSIEVNLKDE